MLPGDVAGTVGLQTAAHENADAIICVRAGIATVACRSLSIQAQAIPSCSAPPLSVSAPSPPKDSSARRLLKETYGISAT